MMTGLNQRRFLKERSFGRFEIGHVKQYTSKFRVAASEQSKTRQIYGHISEGSSNSSTGRRPLVSSATEWEAAALANARIFGSI
jgi:hypothetical protein